MPDTRFSFDVVRMERNLQQLDRKMDRDMKNLFRFAAKHALASMKGNAPWHDNTGRARQGLRARANIDRGRFARHSITLSHTVDYGLWLEEPNRPQGKTARPIIRPTAVATGESLMKAMKVLLDKNGSLAAAFPAVKPRVGGGQFGRGGTRGIGSLSRRKLRSRPSGPNTVRGSRR